MSQVRLHFLAAEPLAKAIATRMEFAFEDEGYPVAAFEEDERTASWAVSVYVPEDEATEITARMEQLMEADGLRAPIEVEPLGDTDWVARSLEGLPAIRAGRFMVAGSHEADRIRPNQTGIVIDAGQAFGTGHHGTTRACLEMLDACLRQRRFHKVLDLGTGSGVLAIAAAKSMPVHVLASDIDPVSVAVARANARFNGVAPGVETLVAGGLSHRRFAEAGPFDLVLANILAGPLAHLARDLTRCLAPGATVILSGLLPHQRARVAAAYRRHGFVLRHSHCVEGWLALVLSNRSEPEPPLRVPASR